MLISQLRAFPGLLFLGDMIVCVPAAVISARRCQETQPYRSIHATNIVLAALTTTTSQKASLLDCPR